jgi:hypothetical protein
MTPRDATHGERDTTANAVFGQRLNGIFRAARVETARAAEKRSEQKLVRAHERDAHVHADTDAVTSHRGAFGVRHEYLG